MSDLRRSRSKVTTFVASDYNFDLLKIRPTIILLIGYFTHPNNHSLYTFPGICGRMRSFFTSTHVCIPFLYSCYHHMIYFPPFFLGNASLHPKELCKAEERRGMIQETKIEKAFLFKGGLGLTLSANKYGNDRAKTLDEFV